ncbi:hypothetical protein PBAL39_12795 [Pedobacter sp. BAL39]|nr:hypothetical protein PBAL39_12795 [Pedobacter sp. BAL39]
MGVFRAAYWRTLFSPLLGGAVRAGGDHISLFPPAYRIIALLSLNPKKQ